MILYAFVLSLLTYCAYCIASWYRRIMAIGAQVDKLPGIDRRWFYVNIKKASGSTEAPLMNMIDIAQRFGNRAFKIWRGPFQPIVMLVHPDTVKLILRTAEPKFNQSEAFRMVKHWLGDGLIMSSGNKWQRNRKLLTPAFHLEVLQSYVPIYNDVADIMLEQWTGRLSSAPGQSIEVDRTISVSVLDIILRCAFSYSSDDLNEGEANMYVSSVLSITKMTAERKLSIPWSFDWFYYRSADGKKFLRTCDYVHDVADKIIRERRKVLEEKPKDVKSKRLDFLDILLMARDENGFGLTDIEIRNEVDTFLSAAHETTTIGITWCLYHLAKHPVYQQKARDEVDSVLGGRESPAVLWEDLREFPYLTMCIKETLRRVPPGPTVSRQLTAPLTVDGVTLLPGTTVLIGIFVVHHNSSVWGDDHIEFKPERFTDEAVKAMHPYAFIPFSAGPRNCIGQHFAMNEIKVVMARILRRFTFE